MTTMVKFDTKYYSKEIVDVEDFWWGILADSIETLIYQRRCTWVQLILLGHCRQAMGTICKNLDNYLTNSNIVGDIARYSERQ